MSYQSTLPSAASFWVNSIPGLDNSQGSNIYAGYLPAREPGTISDKDPADDAHLYFYLEKARHLPSGNGGSTHKRRLMLWLNGGPGCSSFDGVMMEIGSFRPSLSRKGQLEWTMPGGAWNEYTDVLFLDQPVGTGFSYTNTNGYVSTLPQAAQDVNFFLKRFIEVFPEYSKGSGTEFYIAGESFAGQYIPYSAHEIANDQSSAVNLVGIAIGNGAIDPKSQGGSELDMLLTSGVWQKDSKEARKMLELNRECEIAKGKLGSGNNPQEIEGCGRLLQEIISLSYSQTQSNDQPRCINIYDVRLSDTYPACGMNWPPTLQPTYDYLARPDVRKAFHVSQLKHPEAWVECNNRVGSALRSGDSKDPASVTLIPGLIDKGIKVLVFAGDQDLICNYIGIERMIDNLSWGGVKGWGSDPPAKQKWMVNSTAAGYWQTSRNLTYVKVFGASHMVGFDAPVASHDMMLRFMDVDLSEAAGPSVRIQSSLEGQGERPVWLGGSNGEGSQKGSGGSNGIAQTAEQAAEEAKWAAYYNAGSAALVVLLLLVGFGTWFLWRTRKLSHRALPHSAIHLGNNTGDGRRKGRDEEMELEHLVNEDGEIVEEDEDDEEEEDQKYTQASSITKDSSPVSATAAGKGKKKDDKDGRDGDDDGQHTHGQGGEKLFDVGDDD
ncbi:unnamed protein product [Sympodiomycopsis kandeliae]